MRIIAIVLLILPVWVTAGDAQEYSKGTLGELHKATPPFVQGYITGYVSALIETDTIICPFMASGDLIAAALRTAVLEGRISLTEPKGNAVIKALFTLGCRSGK